MNWKPISEAPKDGKRIILRYENYARQIIVCGKWNEDQYINKPKPYWDNDFCWGVKEKRLRIPTHYMDLPEPPND